MTTRTAVSNMVLDYTLNGAPGATHYDVLVLMYNASSKGASSPDTQYAHAFFTPQQLGDVFFNDPDGVHAFMNEASLGKVSLAGRVVGWFDLGPQTISSSTIMQNYQTYAEMATPYADFSKYKIVYFVFLTDSANDSLQIGWQLQNTISVSQGTFIVGIDFMINSDFFLQAGNPYYYSVILPSRSWAHELTHTFGSAGHDVSLNCGTTVFASSCAVDAYGNPFSLMGESAFGNHPSIGVKRSLGFVTTGQLPTVTSTADYAFCPTETVDTAQKGLVIPLKTPISVMSTSGGTTVVYDRLYVEYRRALGFDRYLDRLGTDWLTTFKADGPVREDGVLISLGYQDTSTQATALLDMHPASAYEASTGIVIAGNTGKFADAMLFVGESWDVPNQGIRITVNQLTSDGGIALHVDY